jgi:hypothetical protein
MSVDISAIVGEISWTQSVTNSGFVKTTQGPDKLTATLAPSTTTYNRIYAVKGTLAGGASVTINLQGVTDYLNQSLTLTKVIAFMLKATTTGMKFEPGASNPLTWPLTGTSPVLTVQAGGFFIIGDGAAHTVNATDKNFKITNLDGAVTGTYEIALIGGQ